MLKIKIAFIISNLGQGGAERQFTSLMTHLNPSIFDITLFLYAVQVEPFYGESIKSQNIKIEKSKLKSRFFVLKIAEAILRIRGYLNNNEFDLVVSTLFMNNLLVRLAAPSRYSNRIITSMRTSLTTYPPWYIFWEKHLIKNSYIIFNSKKSLEGFRAIIPARNHNRLKLIYNGFETNVKSEITNSQLFTFGSLGRFNKEKNILQVVRVFKEIEQKLPGSRLIIQGHYGNQYEEIIQAASSKSIEIREKNPDTDTFYSSINVLILSSLFEGCPNVLFEALLRKKICIVSVGANSDNFIINDDNGIVYDGTDDGLKLAMLKVIQVINTPAEIKIKEEGYMYALRNFSIETMISNYENLFINIYEENKSRLYSKDHPAL